MRILLAALSVLLLLLAACGDDDDSENEAAPTATSTATRPPETPNDSPTGDASPTFGGAVDCSPNLESPAAGELLTFEAILPDEIPAPPGYSVVDAAGEGPFLDVLQGDVRVGSVELLQFPLEDDFDPSLGFNALEGWVMDFYDGVETDRVAADPAYEFDPEDPRPAPFGSFCGVAYGFTGRRAGDVIERLVAHATFDSTNLYLLTATYDEGDPETSWSDTDAVDDYAPFLAELAAQLAVPAP